MVIDILFALFYGIWRRCYGGLDSDIWKKWFPKHGSALHRHFWRIVDLVVVFCIMFFHIAMPWYWAVYVALVVQFVFWDWSFGMYMHIGRHKHPLTDEDIQEYNDQLFAPLLDWLFVYGNRYNEPYDYVGMALRFFTPGLLLFFVPGLSISICLAGFFFPLIYLIGVRFLENYSDAKSFFIKNFTELMAGFIAGLLLVL